MPFRSFWIRYVVLSFLLLIVSTSVSAQEDPKNESATAKSDETTEWSFIDNGKIKVGIKRSSGAAIAWVSLSGSDQNLVNHFDRGRLIQQSYYGDRDGSMWDKQPWSWNPVQGGHYQGAGAPVDELEITDKKIFAKSTPVHWATGKVLTDCSMEQTITLDEHVAHVRYRFTYNGQVEHSKHDQEVPAVFLEPQYKNLVLYSGEQPWRTDKLDELERSIPGWPNESRKMTENWAAYVDDQGFGLGAYVPVAKQLTCYRFGDGRREQGACSYFAPLVQFAVKPGFEWQYDLYITLGTQAEIRDRFHQIHLTSAANNQPAKQK